MPQKIRKKHKHQRRKFLQESILIAFDFKRKVSLSARNFATLVPTLNTIYIIYISRDSYSTQKKNTLCSLVVCKITSWKYELYNYINISNVIW